MAELDVRKISNSITQLHLERKIKVFISSICGQKKYDTLRKEIKELIEQTQLADVYLFEDTEAASISAGNHYIWELEECDICIFLIDNKDGIREGVQREIDTVANRQKKALYYFCDEKSKQQTALQKSLIGAAFAKCKTVSSFNELKKNSAEGLINDIIGIYHYYCTGRLEEAHNNIENIQSVVMKGSEYIPQNSLPKVMLSNIDKSKNYILKKILGYNNTLTPMKSNTLDQWTVKFLPILLEGREIAEFNVSMFLEYLSSQQELQYHELVKIRWQAIQKYFTGQTKQCENFLKDALVYARKTNQPKWVVQDILIDLRNLQITEGLWIDKFNTNTAQEELEQEEEYLYYPILDRICSTLHEKYVEVLYKSKAKSPFTFSVGNNFDYYGALLASSVIIPLYHGSLTHILMFYNRLRSFVFVMSQKYPEDVFKQELLKLAIYTGNDKEVTSVENMFPRILNNLDSRTAAEMVRFSDNQPIRFRKTVQKILAFGTVGYYLSDSDFEHCLQEIMDDIRYWINEDSHLSNGLNIFKSLGRVAYRIPQNQLVEICCAFMDHHLVSTYLDIFEFIAKYIDLNKMDISLAEALVQCIIDIMQNDAERLHINYSPAFLYILRRQNEKLTNELDGCVKRYMAPFYNDQYKLETTDNKQADFEPLINQYAQEIKRDNIIQGKNGVFSSKSCRKWMIVNRILLDDEFICRDEILDLLTEEAKDTIIYSKEDIPTKTDALMSLMVIIFKYAESYKRNILIYREIVEQSKQIENTGNAWLSSNIHIAAIDIGICLLKIAMGQDTDLDLAENMALLQGDAATTVFVATMIANCIGMIIPSCGSLINSILLQSALQWINMENLLLRYGATRILMSLVNKTENQMIVNRTIINLINCEGAPIKNYLLKNITTPGVMEATREYVLEKCKQDFNYAVRMVCDEKLKS